MNYVKFKNGYVFKHLRVGILCVIAIHLHLQKYRKTHVTKVVSFIALSQPAVSLKLLPSFSLKLKYMIYQ